MQIIQDYFLSAEDLFYSIYFGSREIIKGQQELDKINVFPVADGDTGSNLAMTVSSFNQMPGDMTSHCQVANYFAEKALENARGNSGIIFANFFCGMSDAICQGQKVHAGEFADIMARGIQNAYDSVVEPAEGTILSVMRDWLVVFRQQVRTVNLAQAFSKAMSAAHESLQSTTERLQVLKENKVVDAGAKGFVLFLEGIRNYLADTSQKYKVQLDRTEQTEWDAAVTEAIPREVEYRYCTQAILTGERIDKIDLRNRLSRFGNSVVLGGHQDKVKFHLHTDRPQDLMSTLLELGQIRQPQVQDMLRESNMIYQPKYPIALVTDTAADLPQHVIDRYDIVVMPLHLSYDGNEFLDKLTISSQNFYQLYNQGEARMKSSQPSVSDFKQLYSSLLRHYEHVVSVHLSSQLSGTWNASRLAAEAISTEKIAVLDSRQLSSSQGLLVKHLAELIERGTDFDELKRRAVLLSTQAEILVSVRDLKYMIRGGRVSRIKGIFARLLKLKPIVSLDEKGASKLFGKSTSFAKNMDKIIELVANKARTHERLEYAIGHVDAAALAAETAARLEATIRKKPAYIMDISPIIGSHAGPGAVSVSTLVF